MVLPRRGVRVREIDGEGVTYDLAHHSIGYLNRLALAVWTRLDGQTSSARLAETIAEACQEDLDEVERYVEETLDALLEAGLADVLLERSGS